ncbi:hypothetical protein QQZ08_003826 [Neonectria magnoliae]|uniref:Arrestin-like N-terminal domain-containing protein n=1 Tax=Neonectria magnoliae TaxID=2732573 RepID=A0ABR1I9W5_9HYPO
MSLRIALDNQPEFYTNLDLIQGRIILGLNRAEQVGSIVVKLEGESATALQVPDSEYGVKPGPVQRPPGTIASENHKILYKLQQVFPDEYYASSSNPYGAYPLHAGEHAFPFKFKLPINNACSDPMAMSQIGGVANAGGFGGGGLFGFGGVRVMDGSKQLYLRHVTKTLPPSLTGYPREAEIRYYIKVTIQRPGLLKENWRYQIGLKFLPIEPPRPKKTDQEAFARRPFTFNLRTPQPERKRSSFFGMRNEDSKNGSTSEPAPGFDSAPSVEMTARLPHPSILTCNQPIPLRLTAKKLANNPEDVYLVSFEMCLIGYTEVRAQSVYNRKLNRWIIVSNANICIPLSTPEDEVSKEIVVPDDVWRNSPLPNTVAPSFATCNLSRKYELEIKLGVAWGKPKKGVAPKQPQVIYLPLHFSQLEVFSGITPPAELLEAARSGRPGRATFNNSTPPRLPPRQSSVSSPSTSGPSSQPAWQAPPQHQTAPPPVHDPLYPPQLAPGQTVAPSDDAPPSYDEAMAESVTVPVDGMRPRPAYSGVTNENAPSHMPPEKS